MDYVEYWQCFGGRCHRIWFCEVVWLFVSLYDIRPVYGHFFQVSVGKELRSSRAYGLFIVWHGDALHMGRILGHWRRWEDGVKKDVLVWRKPDRVELFPIVVLVEERIDKSHKNRLINHCRDLHL
jgi:hypothetical protein